MTATSLELLSTANATRAQYGLRRYADNKQMVQVINPVGVRSHERRNWCPQVISIRTQSNPTSHGHQRPKLGDNRDQTMDIHSNRRKALFSNLYGHVHGLATRPSTGAGGIVFYANYLKFFERARTEWLRSLGIGQQQLREQTGGIFVVTDARLRYLRPARLDDELIVTAQLQETGRASLTIVQQALLNNEQAPNQPRALLSEGTIRIGWVDAASMRPARIPSTLLEQLS